MGMPYQCLKSCGEVLIAARGSSIDSFNIENGSLLSTWKFPSNQEASGTEQKSPKPVAKISSVNLETQKSESSIDVIILESSPPAKRRKLFNAEEEEEEETQKPPEKNGAKKEQKASKKGNKRSDAVFGGLETPAVIALAATEDGRYVIAVTGEDKSIRVFENVVDAEGKQSLKQLSQRAMPKRPCAIAITPDNSTIISADKFGDVYSLPLIVLETTETPLQPTTPAPEPTSAKPFVSAANNLTVHSQRNRKALENQKKQTKKVTEKSEPVFEHKLLLGHVSMLTDLALVTTSEGRSYLLTADRDEHIRVSRGIPQAHIIENFCLAHKEFVSRLCIPKERPDVLISGGGDDTLFVWDWASGRVICRPELRNHVGSVLHEVHGQDLKYGIIDPYNVAVSGITHVRQARSDGFDDLIVVSCEGIPAIFTWLLNVQNQIEFAQYLHLPGNVLDVAADTCGGLIISIDTIHEPALTTERKELDAENIVALQRFVFENRSLIPSSVTFDIAKEDGKIKDSERLKNVFYSLENLRKRDDGREED